MKKRDSIPIKGTILKFLTNCQTPRNGKRSREMLEPEMMMVDGMVDEKDDDDDDETSAEAPNKKLRPDLDVPIRKRGQNPQPRRGLRKNKICSKIQLKMGDCLGFFLDDSQGIKKKIDDKNDFSNV